MEQKWIPVEERLPEEHSSIMPLPEPYRTEPPEPHWKDRMMNTFLGGR